ncbi:MAG: CPXCG motif-containing cysteine-rich protein [Bacteroidetes bacterium]|nr:MAG: CPXCG motif-containing cysteine-rich protein [Bacteroidota bacterium]
MEEDDFEADSLLYRNFQQLVHLKCPACWASISVMVDLSVQAQTYIEDCEVCCRPMEISYQAAEGRLMQFEARALEQ